MRYRFRVWDKRRGEMLLMPERSLGLFVAMPKATDDLTVCELRNINAFCEDQYVMQGTGLTDAEGTEIFEGDVLELRNEAHRYRCSVIFTDGAFQRWYKKHETDTENSLGLLNQSLAMDWRVIGNIHANPELLERTEAT